MMTFKKETELKELKSQFDLLGRQINQSLENKGEKYSGENHKTIQQPVSNMKL